VRSDGLLSHNLTISFGLFLVELGNLNSNESVQRRGLVAH